MQANAVRHVLNVLDRNRTKKLTLDKSEGVNYQIHSLVSFNGHIIKA